jgi:hypothetical protein
MAAIITEKFRIHNAKQFKEDFGESASSSYIFIGRPYPWADDTSPPSPANAVGEEIDSYSDMLALKKIGVSDVSHGLTRYDWDSTGSTKYDEYAHDYSASNTSPATSSNNLYDSRFFVITDEYHVYKCIRTGRNSSGVVVNSTVKPTGTSATALVETSDTGAATGRGYIWKYMYTVSASETIKFVTNDFIPVKTIGAQTEIDGTSGALGNAASDDGTSQWDVENSAVDGGVHHVVVTAGGSGYNDGTYTSVAIDGDGSSGVCTVVVSSGSISHVNITAAGTGYKRASIDIANISGIGSGSGGVAKPIISPLIGHGADPIQELGGNYVIVNSRLEFGEGSGDFPTDNDFRRIGLLQDPFNAGTTTVSTSPTLAAYHKMTLSSVSGLSVDDIILNANSNGTGVAVSRVISITGNVVSHIPQANSEGGYVNFTSSNTVYVGGTTIGTISAVDASFPEVEKYSGQVMYVENRGAVTRAADQIEDIKLIIEM